MLQTLATRLTATIAANEAAMRKLDRIDRIRLLPVTDRLKRYRAHLTAEMKRPLAGPYGTNGRWGPNGFGPSIDDLIRQSEAIRAGALECAA